MQFYFQLQYIAIITYMFDIFCVQDIVKHLRDNWNHLKHANEEFLKKPLVTSIEIKKGNSLYHIKLRPTNNFNIIIVYKINQQL